MPRYVPVRGDENIVSFMKTVLARVAKDQGAGIDFVQDDLVAEVAAFHAEFSATLEAIDGLEKQRRGAVVLAEKKLRMLQMRLRTTWAEVRTRVHAGQDSEELHTYYELTVAGKAPSVSGRKGWIDLAQQVVAGIDKAQAAGFAPVDSHQTLVQAFYEAQEAHAQLSDIKTSLKTMRNRKDAQRPQARMLCDRVVRQLRCFLGDETPSRQRAIMREYGVTFKPNPGEQEEDMKEDGAQEGSVQEQGAQEKGATQEPAPDAATTDFSAEAETADAEPGAAGVPTYSVTPHALPTDNGNGISHRDI